MSRVLSTMTLTSRLLLAISIALVISSIIADLYGAKSNSVYENVLPQSPGVSMFLGVACYTSSGKVKIEVEGTSTAYYLKLGGNPLTLVQQLRALRLNISAESPQVDLRAGVAYIIALIQYNPAIIQALSALGDVIPATRIGGSSVVVEERLATLEAIIMVVSSAIEPSVKVRVEYTVEGYYRLTLVQATIVSMIILVVIAAVEFGRGTLRLKSYPKE